MSIQSRLESLKARHTDLESRLADEDHRPKPDAELVARIKREKLHLKEEMERLRATAPA